MTYRLFGILLLFFSPGSVFASDIMFEGYYRIELEGKSIGFTVLRYSFDPVSHTFEAASFLRAKFGEKIVQESTKAKANDKLKPISYQYTSQVGDEMKMIDGNFKGDIMTLNISDGKKVKNETYKNPKGTFLSIFLPYLLLQQKLELNQNFKYSAVAEEDGGAYWGNAWLQAKETRPGFDVYNVLNRFKGEQFYSKMAFVKDGKDATKNIKGEVLSVTMPNKNLTEKLVTSAATATEGQLVPNKTLLTLFGEMPAGKANLVATPPELDSGVGPKGKVATPVPPADDDTMMQLTEPPPSKPVPKAKASGK